MDGAQRPPEGRSAVDLLSQLAGDLTNLVRKESELVRTELTEKAHSAVKAVGEVAAGSLLMIAALLVGGVVALAGFVVLRAGMKMLKPEALTPDRSARQLQKNAELMKGHSR